MIVGMLVEYQIAELCLHTETYAINMISLVTSTLNWQCLNDFLTSDPQDMHLLFTYIFTDSIYKHISEARSNYTIVRIGHYFTSL